jgi:carbonic anhydrase
MSLISEMLEHNAGFVERREYEAYQTTQFPNKKLVVVTCMDTRLGELLPKAMNLRNGDVKMIRVAGAVVLHPFGSVMRSILIAVYNLDAQEIAVVGHHDCGMVDLNSRVILEKAQREGISEDVLKTLDHSGIELAKWLSGFSRVEEGVRASVKTIRNHPLLPRRIAVHGMVMHPQTGKLDLLEMGYGEPGLQG